FQAFDIGDIDFADPVQAMHYEHHVEFPYPTHGPNCESCHVEGTYNMPSQLSSLPGIQSATSTITGWDRAIPDMPSVVVGPGARACGGCHVAELINEDNAAELIPLKIHMENGGYSVEAGEQPLDTLDAVIQQIMGFFQ
ncbi:MAG: hypothetical protein KDE24_36455, partial [Caldilinea sp.]|nr:hypothetical protein [Caldilinea sp.]